MDSKKILNSCLGERYAARNKSTGTMRLQLCCASPWSDCSGQRQATADATADAANYRDLILQRLRAGDSANVSTIDTSAPGLTAFGMRDGAVAANSAGADLEPATSYSSTQIQSAQVGL
ncbi:hypothetical protein [Mesorhizobium sp. M0496]|uniref:hypothetical protein n=1 Tax=Mesorhizobium sp. M0496 TaxID=2956952 RepID=UPI00333E0E45